MLVKIPIEIIELDNASFHLFVEGFVNGRRCDFIIDTGASRTVFALNHIHDILNEPATVHNEIQSAGINASQIESHQGVLDEFRVGCFCEKNLDIILIDLDSIDRLYKNISTKSIWGLIGSDFLLACQATINYRKRLLTLSVPKSKVMSSKV